MEGGILDVYSNVGKMGESDGEEVSQYIEYIFWRQLVDFSIVYQRVGAVVGVEFELGVLFVEQEKFGKGES